MWIRSPGWESGIQEAVPPSKSHNFLISIFKCLDTFLNKTNSPKYKNVMQKFSVFVVFCRWPGPWARSSANQKNKSSFFKKSVDKQEIMWYNTYIIKREHLPPPVLSMCCCNSFICSLFVKERPWSMTTVFCFVKIGKRWAVSPDSPATTCKLPSQRETRQNEIKLHVANLYNIQKTYAEI